MALAMARPWKHPKTGMFWLRKRVPDDLRDVVGKREEKRSLQTKDPAEARRLHANALAEVEARWASLRRGTVSLSQREAHVIAVQFYEGFIAHYAQNPKSQTEWDPSLGDQVFRQTPSEMLRSGQAVEEWLRETFDPNLVRKQAMESWCFSLADTHCTKVGLRLAETGRRALAEAIARSVQRASLTLKRFEEGDYALEDQPLNSFSYTRPIAEAEHPPTTYPNGSRQAKISFGDLLEVWVKERTPREKTEYSWRRVIDQLVHFLGHDDASKLTSEDLIRWKMALVEEGLNPKTIREGKLAAVRAILQSGVDNRRLTSNVGERVTITVKARPGETKRSFTDAEARIVLSAALKAREAHCRWIPWLCAYTGARVAEVCQVRAEDILQQEGIWCVHFTPEAGALKNTNSERLVPLHPAILESGFLSFVQQVRSGPLFVDLTPDRFGSRGGNGTKVLSRFVRSLGLDDVRLSPSHSWRHRLKTLGRRHGLASDIVNAITGHGKKSIADTYGEFPIDALYRELTKIPSIQVS